ncbi:HAMP domain-containing sensor histidine kinase [Peptoniphilus catoniae]|uniref:HAMP domain-containing sensor histidine kinase n=1 Tax=Peptoniphilus catoniae TaxID=1660341 RepID=UPI001FE86745|nr:HAMP domain-containing sensor histidine kinase [Peptoniphilus catoniae]
MPENKKIKLDKNSIMFTFWKYFSIFAVAILLLLWLLQIVFLNRFYESMKINEVTKIGDYLRGQFEKDNFETQILNYSQRKGMNIEVIDEEGHLIYPLTLIDVIINPKVIDQETFNEFFKGVKDGKKPSRVFITRFENLENPSIVYAGYLGKTGASTYYITIKTALEPLDSTTDILKKMLMIVSVLAFLLGLLLSYYFSKRLSKPLVEMSRTAKQLGSGDYSVHFKHVNYTEIDDLSKTLNYATDELTKTIELRKDLVANVSHDLKTPLTVIKSYGEMIRDISGDNKSLRDKHINTIIDEADRLTDFVNDLLDLSKIESSLEEVKLEEVDLSEITKEVMERFQKSLPKESYEFILKKEGRTHIIADKKRLEQAIYNLINNAVNYSGKEKTIRLEVIGKNGMVEFSCIDKGIGIDKSDINNIWDRFYTARANHSRPTVGTGLGLYIVKNIFEMHKFEYGVESELNKGSRFYFRAKAV